MDIKDVLMSGDATAEELLAQFKKELEAAQAEIAAAKEKEAQEQAAAREEEIADARYEVAEAVIDYLVALDIVEEDDVEDADYDKIVDAIQDAEKQFKAYVDLAKHLEKLQAPNDMDEKAIANFLKTLM